MSSIVRKIDEAVHPERHTVGGTTTGTHHTTGTTTGTTGVTGTHHHGHHTAGTTGVTGTTGTAGGLHGNNLPGPAPNTAGPHSSDLLNKL
jgi:hypothetical protein